MNKFQLYLFNALFFFSKNQSRFLYLLGLTIFKSFTMKNKNFPRKLYIYIYYKILQAQFGYHMKSNDTVNDLYRKGVEKYDSVSLI
jgi:hypothetical protein